MQDIDLILLCKEGNVGAQKMLFMRHSPLLFNVALRYTRSKEDAEDALQESWVNIFNSLDTYKEEGKLIAWMKKIVINKSLRNSNNSWFNTELMEVMDLEVSGEEPMVLQDLESEEILKVINRLPDGYSQIFKLNVIDGYKHAEIAEIMGIGESTSRSKLTIARTKLKDLILGTSKIIN